MNGATRVRSSRWSGQRAGGWFIVPFSSSAGGEVGSSSSFFMLGRLIMEPDGALCPTRTQAGRGQPMRPGAWFHSGLMGQCRPTKELE